MKEIKRDNAVINYQLIGNGETTLLFVHGSYIDQTYWREQALFFSKSFTVVTLDLPGHGLSGRERKNWSTDSFADDVVTVVSELELKNVILIAHSWGADVALMAAIKYPRPFIGFIAIDYFKNAATQVVPQNEVDAIKANLKRDFAGTNESYCRMALLTPETPVEIANRAIKDFRNAYEPMGQAVTPEIFSMYQVQKDLLPKLPFKLYLVNVDYQPTNETPLKEFCKNGYEVLHLRGTSHFPMIERPAELNKQLMHAVNAIAGSLAHSN
ncbi:alpha/beta hydrolase [Chryseolinea sp. T2]|uniref:alpha/beta fold hydrolase n=1 Tax=Chryseolinea sp. T2 TaxID=3129255 RepID=UPI0030769922